MRRLHDRLDGANSVFNWAVFLNSPRYRTFVCPNYRMMTRNGCTTLALSVSILSGIAPSLATISASSDRWAAWRWPPHVAFASGRLERRPALLADGHLRLDQLHQ